MNEKIKSKTKKEGKRKIEILGKREEDEDRERWRSI
jgi:hypothetical protein